MFVTRHIATKQIVTTSSFFDLDFAKLTHSVHVEADDRCALCIADEIEQSADARLEELRSEELFTSRSRDKLIGQLFTAAHARRDLAEMLREGDATLKLVERSNAFGLQLRYSLKESMI